MSIFLQESGWLWSTATTGITPCQWNPSLDFSGSSEPCFSRPPLPLLRSTLSMVPSTLVRGCSKWICMKPLCRSRYQTLPFTLCFRLSAFMPEFPGMKHELFGSASFPRLSRIVWFSANQSRNTMKVGIAIRIIVDHFLCIPERFQLRKPCC